jgi:hypothetical protein
VPQAKVAFTEIGQRDGAPAQGWLRFLMCPAKVELDGRVSTAGFAQVLGQRVHALEVGGIAAAFRSPILSWRSGEAAPALDMSSCEVDEPAVRPEATSSASIVADLLNDEKGGGLRLPHCLQPSSATDVEPLAHGRSARSRLRP